jgi:hypothetical protein
MHRLRMARRKPFATPSAQGSVSTRTWLVVPVVSQERTFAAGTAADRCRLLGVFRQPLLSGPAGGDATFPGAHELSMPSQKTAALWAV